MAARVLELPRGPRRYRTRGTFRAQPGGRILAPYGSDFGSPGARDSYGRDNANTRGYGGKRPALLFVASNGVLGGFATSVDGQTLDTSYPRPVAENFWGCAYSRPLGLYIATINDSIAQRVYTSPTALAGSWTAQTVGGSRPLTYVQWHDDEDRFVIATDQGGAGGTGTNRFFWTEDGAAFTGVFCENSVGGDGDFRTEANLLVGPDGTVLGFGTTGGSVGAAKSPDGIANYVEQNTVNSATVSGATYDTFRERWVILNEAENVLTSPTGETGDWTVRNAGTIPSQAGKLGYCEPTDRLVASSSSGGTSHLWESTDGGVTWAPILPDPINAQALQIKYIPAYRLIYVLSGTSPAIVASETGASGSWFNVTTGGNDYRDVTYLP